MACIRSSAACLAAALALSPHCLALDPQGLDLDTGVATRPQYSSEKHIGGVPVLGYEHAYSGKTQSMHVLSEGEDVVPALHEEDWIVVLNKETPNERLVEMCSMARMGCKVQSKSSAFSFIAMRGTEDDLATVVTPVSNTASYIALDLVVNVDPIERQDVSSGVGGAAGDMIWGLKRIGADKRDFQGTGVHIYVADTGVRLQHQDFGGRAKAFGDMFVETCGSACPNKEEPVNLSWSLGTGLCVNSSNTTCGDDYYGHGTHCASTAGGTQYGVAPQAIIHSLKVLSDQGPGSSAGIIFGLNLVISHGEKPAVISMSLGGWGKSEAWKTAIDACVDAGITVSVAAGNDYNDACRVSPAFVTSAISVGATDVTDTRAGFSNWGSCVDIWAPGRFIEAAFGEGVIDESTLNQTVEYSGTSMACPHVSGAVALLLEENPNLKPAEVLTELRKTVSKDYVIDLSPNDRNELLYIGNDAPEPVGNQSLSAVWPGDEYFMACRGTGSAIGPSFRTDECRCSSVFREEGWEATTCYNGDKEGCLLSPQSEMRNESDVLRLTNYVYNCTTCRCLTAAEAAPSTTTAPSSPVRPPFNFGPNPLLLGAGLATVLLLVAIGYFWPQDAGVDAPSEVPAEANTEMATSSEIPVP